MYYLYINHSKSIKKRIKNVTNRDEIVPLAETNIFNSPVTRWPDQKMLQNVPLAETTQINVTNHGTHRPSSRDDTHKTIKLKKKRISWSNNGLKNWDQRHHRRDHSVRHWHLLPNLHWEMGFLGFQFPPRLHRGEVLHYSKYSVIHTFSLLQTPSLH